MIRLIKVQTLEDEARILDRLEHLGCPAGVSPVLDSGALLPSLMRALRAARIAHDVVASDDETLDSVVRRGNAVETGGGSLLSVFVGLMDPAVERLARFLCTAGRKPRRRPSGTVVIFAADQVEAEELLEILRDLDHRGVPFGLLPLPKDDAGRRLILLKGLLVPTLCQWSYSLISGLASADGEAGGAPRSLYRTGRTDTGTWQAMDTEVCLFTGHANALDAAVGPNLVFCAREGTPDGERHPGGVMPCFVDGLCFRQRVFGRDAAGREGLADIAAARYRILVLSGCNLLSIGRGWADPVRALAGQALRRSGALAVVAALTLIEGGLEYDILLLALLAEGVPLGQVVAEVNAARNRVSGRQVAGGHGDGTGPFLLLGNPLLRLGGPALRTPLVRIEGDSLRINLDGLPMDGEGGKFLRIPVAGLGEGHFEIEVLRPKSPELWCRGVVHRRDGKDYLYVLVGAEPGVGTPNDELVLRRRATWRFAAERAFLRQVLDGAPFWMQFLWHYARESQRCALSASPFSDVLQVLQDGLPALRLGVAATRPRPDVLVGTADTPAAFVKDLLALADRLLWGYLDTSAEVAMRWGTMQFAAWEGVYPPPRKSVAAESCACGASGMLKWCFHAPEQGLPDRAVYECLRCGVVGEDDGREVMRLHIPGGAVAVGSRIALKLQFSVPDATLEIRALALLEIWMKDRRILGERILHLAASEESAEIVLFLDLPGDLTAGVYTVAVIAVLDGQLAIARRILDVV